MSAMSNLVPPADVAAICAQIERAPDIDRLRALLPDASGLDADIVGAVLEEASKFAQAWLNPLNPATDRHGCRVDEGRVRTAPGHVEAWQAYRDAGWLGVDQAADLGGQELPLVVLAACTEIFDRGCVAFGMLPTAQRAAARLLAAHADTAMKDEWLARLVSGEWTATICISEPDAGSDVGRIRTLAEPGEDGEWRITGEKIWISYGDHDLGSRIGHCILARTPGAAPGAAGLSLFLAPDSHPGPGGEPVRNAIAVRRLEEKMGLHGSPTCALGFEGARARMIGQPGRGLSQLFTMIAVMRLMVAVQGLALAGGAADVALGYAEERRQGGASDAAPTPIVEHADVQRMLMNMSSRVEVVRGVILAAAVQADIGRLETDPERAARANALSSWLLPIAKTFGGETAFEIASEAIQVLGGAGYVKDWPVEQTLRDSRVFTIFEGTSGIQALDLLHRRLRRDKGAGLQAFLDAARADVDASHRQEAAAVGRTLDLLQEAARRLAAGNSDTPAYALLKLAAHAATGWIALRLAGIEGQDPAARRLAAAGRWQLADLESRAAFEHAQTLIGDERMALFEAVRRRP